VGTGNTTEMRDVKILLKISDFLIIRIAVYDVQIQRVLKEKLHKRIYIVKQVDMCQVYLVMISNTV